ncbi:MAG: hypothetical protein COT74_04825 [Bdellovibrionales bacterium CG10_big_fil_rev_8_21_14_0_10_45_34]|nr:MAG: hypothetical protein COT74_04825 [Bdellovibrionales bacterium CG10_big_fil_rev_8_21_14_0_10_45_34]
MIDLLKDSKIIICCGSGGVGKTTISSALGVLGAKSGLKVLVMTLDPARRLAAALGLDHWDGQDRLVSRYESGGEFWASMVDPEGVFHSFVEKYAPSEVAAEIRSNNIFQQISTSLSGSQEYSSLEKLYQVSSLANYDLIVLDTPPAQHAMDFLMAPQKFFSLFQESVVTWLSKADKASGTFVGSILTKGTQVVFKALETLTGKVFLTELSTFFKTVRTLAEPIREHSSKIQSLLISPTTQFVLVTSSDSVKLEEARSFFQNLKRRGHSLSAVIVNRAFPEWALEGTDIELIAQDSELKKMIEVFHRVAKHFESAKEDIAHFESQLSTRVYVKKVPELQKQPYELDNLNQLADILKN